MTSAESRVVKVTAAILIRDGRILIARRRQGDLARKWEFPGGKVESGESLEECLKRELHEEFGIEVDVHEQVARNRDRYPWIEIDLIAFRVSHVSGNLQLRDHEEIRWVNLSELNDFDLSEADVPIARALAQTEMKGETMDIFTAIRGRRSCRKYLPDAVGRETIEAILEAGNWAPSPANQQPWEFSVVTRAAIKERIYQDSMQCKQKLFERSGWKWVEKFPLDFVREAPVLIVVAADPKKSGADMFLDEGTGRGYVEACSAAVQNMMLAAHALGLGTLWFSLYETSAVRKAVGISEEKDIVGIVCIGKPAASAPVKRKDFREKTVWLE